MGFTNVWDNTQPPDTQAANQLGLDLRNLRLDTQQRMAAVSGLDAAKPALEAGFGGMIYVASDTNKVYQFTGTGWSFLGYLVGNTGQLVVPNGTQALPGFTFADGSAATGFFSDAADTIEAAVSGNKMLSIAAALLKFFVVPQIDATVADLAQTDLSGSLVSTNWLAAQAKSGLRYNLGSPDGFIAFPKWLTGGATQLVVKWGSPLANTVPYTVNFDATVPFGAPPVVVTGINDSGGYILTGTITATNFVAYSGGNHPVCYVAIGHS